ncbi:alpha/beta hydrolase [Bacillus sp. JJ1532]|uniref:alpha/beta fold hydrolase n=1 Tax=unclassified Bacillus (in: firmicutes) TaxID=185979 RepID=UPI0030005024
MISFDLRGHGDSEKPEHVDYTIEKFSEDLRKLMESLNITSAVLVGLSMGGAIVQRFALDHPNLVRALILVGTTAYGLGPMVQAKNVINRIDEIGIEEASKEVIRHSFSSTTSQSVVKWAENEVIKTPKHVAKQAIRSLDSFDVRQEIHSLNIPTMIIVGEEDDITPVKESEYLYDNIKGSELYIISKAAHFPMLEQPFEFNSHMLKFLSGLPVFELH